MKSECESPPPDLPTTSLPPLPKFNPKRHTSDPFDIPSPSFPVPCPPPATPGGEQGTDTLLPPGWSKRTDQLTGMSYFENHWTMTTTWTDPRSLPPSLLSEHSWSDPPAGWDFLQDGQGRGYWVHHDSQTSSWSGPRERRVRRLLERLRERFLSLLSGVRSHRDRSQELRTEILDLLGAKGSDGKVFALNDELERESRKIERIESSLEYLQSLIVDSVDELTGVKNQATRTTELAHALHDMYLEAHSLYSHQHKLVVAFYRALGRPDRPTMPPPVEESVSVEKIQSVHLLPDHLTPKTSLEMCLELKLLQEYTQLIKSQLNRLVAKVESAVEQAEGKIREGGMEQQLAKYELRPVYLELMEAAFEELMDRFLQN